MPEPQPLTDSQVAAIAARDALNDRRYALAEAFARVARIAAQHEAAQARYDADTARMKEDSDALLDQWAQIQAGEADAAAAAASTPIGNSFAAQLDADATAIGSIPPAPADAPAVVIPPPPPPLTHGQAWEQTGGQGAPTAHCRQQTTYGPCDKPIWLAADNIWRHIHASLDHPAVPPQHPASDMSRS